MNTQEQEQALAQERAAFEQSFGAETVNHHAGTSTAASSDAVAEVAEVADPATSTEATAPEGGEAAPGEATAAVAKAETPEATPQDDDPVLLDGLKRSELHRLLSSAAEVPNLKKQLDKAHGNIGELNRKIQQAQSATAATPASTVEPELSPKQRQFEEDYPDVAEYIRAIGIQPQQQPQSTQPVQVQQPDPTGGAHAAQAVADPVALELAVMDRMHKGWREKVQSQEFDLWLTTQGEQARASFDAAQSADDLAAVIGQYDQWAAARTAAADKAAKGQQRLKAAVTPNGNAPRPQAAPTEQEAFEAAFRST